MQKDFHFYGIYVLCRCKGMSPEHSKIIAYASQHTDDAKYDHTLEFENGGHFKQVLSAHQFIHPEVFALDTQYRIYIPFHFIPGNTGSRFQEKMVCRENSDIAQEMVREVSSLKEKPYILHRLGIALHAYADTWAHRDFSGLQTELNDIKDVDVRNDEKKGIAKVFASFFRNVTEAVIPYIGHAEAATLPDEPYREWSYYNVYEDRQVYRRNWMHCVDAYRAIYQEIRHFLSRNPEFKTQPPVHWGSIRSTSRNLFMAKGALEERCNNWMKSINSSSFGFECLPEEKNLKYDDREWFKKAVRVKKDKGASKDRYYRKKNFHTSDWKYFHDAAISHRFFVHSDLLSPREIICS
jgi:hypothetical protein